MGRRDSIHGFWLFSWDAVDSSDEWRLSLAEGDKEGENEKWRDAFRRGSEAWGEGITKQLDSRTKKQSIKKTKPSTW